MIVPCIRHGLRHVSTSCGVASLQIAAVVTKKSLRVDLTAAWLIIEKHDWLVSVLAAAVRPYVRRTCGFLVLFLQHLNERLIGMNERLRLKPQSQRIANAMQVPLVRTDHPAPRLIGVPARSNVCARR